MKYLVQLQKEGTIYVLYRSGKAVECWTYEERSAAFNAYRAAVNEGVEQENKHRRLVARDPITYESYEAHCSTRGCGLFEEESFNAVLR